jgi:hypothetical protein
MRERVKRVVRDEKDLCRNWGGGRDSNKLCDEMS